MPIPGDHGGMAGWLAESQRRTEHTIRSLPPGGPGGGSRWPCTIPSLPQARQPSASGARRRAAQCTFAVSICALRALHWKRKSGKPGSSFELFHSRPLAVGPSDFAQTAFHTTNDAAASCFPACACCLLACSLGRRWPLSAWAPQCTANPRPPSSCSARIQRPRIN